MQELVQLSLSLPKQEQAVQSASLKILKKGTVLLSSRAPIGKVAIAGIDLYCNQFIEEIRSISKWKYSGLAELLSKFFNQIFEIARKTTSVEELFRALKYIVDVLNGIEE